MSALETRAEILKLAALLRLKSTSLAFLQEVPAGSIRRLREQFGARLLEERQVQLERLALLAQFTPAPVAALFGRRLLGPLLCAGLASRMPPEQVLRIAAHLDDGFLAEVAVELAPEHARSLIGSLPPERAASIAAILLRRGELAVLSRLLEALSGRSLRLALDQVQDNGALLKLLFTFGSQERINEALGLLPVERLQQLILAPAHGAAELWPQSLWLLSVLDDARRRALGEVVAGQDDTVLDGLIDAVRGAGLWSTAMPIFSVLGDASLRRLLTRPAMLARDAVEGLLGAVSSSGQWTEFGHLLQIGGEPLQRSVAQAMTGVSQAMLLSLLKAMVRYNLAEVVLPMLLRLDPAALQVLAKAAAALPPTMAIKLEQQLLVAGAGQALAAVRSALLGRK